jgi:hypothetical protein
MMIEIGALVAKDSGQAIIEGVKNVDGVVTAFMEAGRSDDLFEEKQFGEFGEAAILTVLASEDKKEEVLKQIFLAAELDTREVGIMYSNTQILRTTVD